jgi:hypothetical protein
MGRFRKKPVEIEAVLWTGLNVVEVCDFIGGEIFFDNEMRIEIETLEGTMKANVGDWIIKGVKGEFYPCKPEIFDTSYEEIT